MWHRVAGSVGDFAGDRRKHLDIEGRIVTVLQHKDKMYCFDTVCYHAGGPLGRGPIVDIEDLDASCVKCPWHSYCLDMKTGDRIYQSCDMVDGRLVPGGWKRGPPQQRTHKIEVRTDGSVYIQIDTDPEPRQSDEYAQCKDARKYILAQRMLESSTDSPVSIHSGRVLNPEK
eukprot:PhF_6_TR33573/c0_g1_i2/m.48989